MSLIKQKIVPFLWFDKQAEEAANFYTAIFENSSIGRVSRFCEEGQEPVGSVRVIEFVLAGQVFVAINAGPMFTFNEAVSFVVNCDTQEELDYFWHRLGEGGDESAQQCGWLKDKFGLSWQITPTELPTLLSDPDNNKANRAMSAMMQMKKIDLAALKQAHSG